MSIVHGGQKDSSQSYLKGSRPLLFWGFGPQDGYLPPLFADQEVSCRHPICGQFVEETKEKISRKVGWKWCFEPNRTKTRPERAKKGKLPSPKIHPFFWQNLWPLYFTSVFLYSVLVSLPGLYFISANVQVGGCYDHQSRSAFTIQYHPLLTQYHYIPTRTILYWPSTTKYQLFLQIFPKHQNINKRFALFTWSS